MIIEKIVENHRNDEIVKQYIDILKKIHVYLNMSCIVFIAIILNCNHVIDMLIDQKFDFNVSNSQQMTAMSLIISYNRKDMVRKILDHTVKTFGLKKLSKIIHSSPLNYNSRPLFLCIDNLDDSDHHGIMRTFINYMNIIIEDKRKKNKLNDNGYLTKYYDNDKCTYLHAFLCEMDDDNIPHDILEFLINNTDVNCQNYNGETPYHTIFRDRIWKNIKKMLEGRSIDIEITNNTGISCKSYINEYTDEEYDEVNKLLKKMKIVTFVKKNDTFDISHVKDVIDLNDENNIGPFNNVGLFNSNMIHHMIYLKYIMNKYNNIYIPHCKYDQKNKKYDILTHEMTFFPTCDKKIIMNDLITGYLLHYYSFAPSVIYWIDKDQYHINPQLMNLLIDNNNGNTHRYVYIKLTDIIDNEKIHAHCLIYDRKNKEAWRFDSYAYDNDDFDAILNDYLTTIYGKIKYNAPKDFMIGYNFQLFDGEGYMRHMKQNDAHGYCLAWTFWFIEMVIKYENMSVKKIISDFITRESIDEIISDDENAKLISENHYADFIRRYARKLDREKNRILKNIGISSYKIYDKKHTTKDLAKIYDLFKMQ
jgi:hypothetical protein